MIVDRLEIPGARTRNSWVKNGVEVLLQVRHTSRKQNAIWQKRYQSKPFPLSISDFMTKNCVLVPFLLKGSESLAYFCSSHAREMAAPNFEKEDWGKWDIYLAQF